ncbi:MAG: cytochrome c biogenesis protein CcdA [Pseudomonadota bacterium]
MFDTTAFQEFPYIISFLAGFLSFLSPCVLPLVPGYLSFIAGIRIEDAEQNTPLIKTKLISSSILFVAGFSLIFIILGAGASGIAPLLKSYQVLLTQIAGILIIVFGLHMIGAFKLTFLYRELRLGANINEVQSLVTPFLLGMAFGLGWTPCIGPILTSVLLLASQQETITEGMALLSLYSAGLGIPFLIAAMSLGMFQKKSNHIKRHLGLIEKIAGVLLLLTGIFIFTGSLQHFGTFLIETFPFLAKLG